MGFARWCTNRMFVRIRSRVGATHSMVLEAMSLAFEQDLGLGATTKDALLAHLAAASRCTTSYLWSAQDDLAGSGQPPLEEIARRASIDRCRVVVVERAQPSAYVSGLLKASHREIKRVRKTFVRFDASERLILLLTTAAEHLTSAEALCRGATTPPPGPEMTLA